jgi:phosphohistidine phosphatase
LASCIGLGSLYAFGMLLYLLRHGIAVEPGTPGFENDADRPLIPKGRKQLRKVAATMLEMDLGIELILSSPLVRARQTAEVIAGVLGLKKRLTLSNALAVGGDPMGLIRQMSRLKPVPKGVLLVGHEPGMSQLMSLLLTGETHLMEVEFKKAGLCKLEIMELKDGRCAKLVWLLTPKLMKTMA